MANNYSAQATATIRVLRTNDNLTLIFNNNGIVLYQAIDTVTGAISPDWTIPANQPIRTPVVHTTQGALATITMHKYKYNGQEINFEDGVTSEGWTTDTTGRFQLKQSDGSIKIIKNLASEINYADDILSYECQVSVAGVEYNMTFDMTIAIQKMGASSFYGALMASSNKLTEAKPTITIDSVLFQGGMQMSAYDVVWFKGTTEWTTKTGKTISVTRADVDSSQLIIAEFRKDGTVVARAGLTIVDEADEYKLLPQITSKNKEIVQPYEDTAGNMIAGKSVTLKFVLINMRTKAEVTPASASYVTTLLSRNDWQEIRTVNSNIVTVTPTDSKVGDTYEEVEAHCISEFTI